MAKRSEIPQVAPITLRIKTAAAIFDLPEGTILADVRSGKLRGRKAGRCWLIDPDDAIALYRPAIRTRLPTDARRTA